MRSNRTALIVLLAILFLFFLQALSDFIISIYSFGLLITGFPVQLAAVVLMFSPVALLVARGKPTRGWIIGLAAVAVLGRLLEPMLNPDARLVACGLSVGAFMLLFPCMLGAFARGPDAAASGPNIEGWSAARGLLMAVMLSILFRAAGSGVDVSELAIYEFVSWVLAVLAGRLIWRLELGEALPEVTGAGGRPEARPQALTHDERRQESLKRLEASERRSREHAARAAPVSHGERPSTRRVIAVCIGVASAMLILYFAFVSPTVIARWTGYSYPLILVVMLLAFVLFAYVLTRPRAAKLLTGRVVVAWNVLFVLMLVLTILPHQVAFPARPDGFPIEAPAPSALGQVPLILMLILSPVVFVDFRLYTRQLLLEGPSMRQLGGGFFLAALYMFVMILLHVLTTVYDYLAPVGGLLRDRFWLVYLLAGLGLALPMLAIRRRKEAKSAAADTASNGVGSERRFAFWSAAGLAVLSGAALYLTAARPPRVEAANGGLRVMTYNIQQSFDKAGAKDLQGQLAAMEKVAPDVLGLEESDTARIANGNDDAVRFFADRLNMYSYYGPTTTTGTFGIALLSRYPIQKARTFFMYSKGEQTACIQAQIAANGRTYNIFVTHLGNDGPMVQLQDVLERVDGLRDVILMGDFNFDPTTPQYALARQSLPDAWLERWPAGHKLYAPGTAGRIDLLFVSPGTQISDADYVADGSSDHPYLYAVIAP